MEAAQSSPATGHRDSHFIWSGFSVDEFELARVDTSPPGVGERLAWVENRDWIFIPPDDERRDEISRLLRNSNGRLESDRQITSRCLPQIRHDKVNGGIAVLSCAKLGSDHGLGVRATISRRGRQGENRDDRRDHPRDRADGVTVRVDPVPQSQALHTMHALSALDSVD